MYKKPKTITLMLKLILLTLMVTIFFSQYRSPQYIVWFSPIAAILIAEDIWGIAAFICTQLVAFVEFPLMFYTLYVNDHFTSPFALGFFTIDFILLGFLLWRALVKKDVNPVPENITKNTKKQKKFC
jgi:cytochrome c oxidase assembly factor CtaG